MAAYTLKCKSNIPITRILNILTELQNSWRSGLESVSVSVECITRNITNKNIFAGQSKMLGEK